MGVITHGGILTSATRRIQQTPLRAQSTATGCTASSATRPPAPATGPVGMGPPPSSSVSEGCCTTSRPQSQPQPLEANEPLPFNLPPGAVPLNANNWFTAGQGFFCTFSDTTNKNTF